MAADAIDALRQKLDRIGDKERRKRFRQKLNKLDSLGRKKQGAGAKVEKVLKKLERVIDEAAKDDSQSAKGQAGRIDSWDFR